MKEKGNQSLLNSIALNYLYSESNFKDMAKLINLVGKTFGRLNVISISHREGTKIYWNCLCACGNVVCVRSQSLHQGRTQSCGCLHLDIVTKHGNTGIKEHKIWMSIKNRCLNPKDKSFKDYGGRGITVCDRWINSYNNFFEDMGACPSVNHSIDRIKNNEGYGPDNCKWSTRTEQANNRRSNVTIYRNGETKTLTQWCRELNKSYARVWQRINIQNWSVDRALNT